MAVLTVTSTESVNNVSYVYEDDYETLEELNERYANALLPMAMWLGLLAAMGIVGNALVIIVFSVSPEYKNTNFKVFVISLAIVDLLTCITLLPADIVKTRHYFSFPDSLPCKVKCFFNLFGQNASAFVLLVICVDRYRKVCRPLNVQIWPSLATKIISAIIVLSFFLSLPAPILAGISSTNTTNINGTNITVFFCAAEDRYIKSPVRYAYKIGLTVSFAAIAVALVVMYAFILKTIIKHWRKRRNGGSLHFESYEPEQNYYQTEKRTFPNEIKMEASPFEICLQKNGNAVHTCMPMLHGLQNGKKKRSMSTNSNVSTKTQSSIRKSGSLRSCSNYSLRAYSLRRLTPTYTKIPYKTLIWIILTFVFIATYLIHALLSFETTELHEMSPSHLLGFMFFFRIYFINNIINPIIYFSLDKRFKVSCCYLINLLKRKLRLCCM